MKNKYDYTNIQICQNGGRKTIHKVSISNKKGYKSISHYVKGRHQKTHKKRLNKEEIYKIKEKKFIPGLFKNCNCTRKK